MTNPDDGIRLRSLWAAIDRSQALIEFDLDGNILTANANFLAILGYDLDDIAGRHHSMFCDPVYAASDDYRAFWARLARGEFEVAEYKRLRKDGGEVWLQASYNPIFDQNGEPYKVVKFATDVTNARLLHLELARHVQALERSNKDLDDFAYIASHDLKEPLRGISNNARFLREDHAEILPQEGVNRLVRMSYLTQRMERLIDDLLYFSRLGHQDLAIRPTDLNAVIWEVRTMSETTLRERNAVVAVPRELPNIACDRTRVTEVFRNLILNAVKYNDSAEKRVEIGYRDECEGTIFHVKDNGIGIAAEFHEDVFRIFKRLNAEDDDKKGTGVGLTFVRKIVERHGGRIWLESALGEGSTFCFTLDPGAAHGI